MGCEWHSPIQKTLQQVDSRLVDRPLGQARPPGVGRDELSERSEIWADMEVGIGQVPKPEISLGGLRSRAELVVPVMLVSQPRFVSEREVGDPSGIQRDELVRLPPRA